MRMELHFKALPVFLLGLVHFSMASVNSCCSFQHLKHCQVFSWNGISYCSQETEPGLSYGGCRTDNSGKKKWVPAHITDIDVKYQISRCHNRKGSNNDATCSEYHSRGFITLNVSFALGGPDLTGILFQVVSSKDPLKGPTCHYVYLNDTLNYGHVIEDQRATKFYFAGFDEVFEPRIKYIIHIRVLPAPKNSSLDRVYNHSIVIPDCNHLPDDVYFCSLPSAAKWVSNITTAVLEDQGSVNVSFTINNNTRDFTDYEVKLWQLPENITIERRSVLNNKDKWYCDGQTCVMHEAFNVSAGYYYVTVQANKNGFSSSGSCRKDKYRVQDGCRIAYSAKFVLEAVHATTILPTVTELITLDVTSSDQWPLWHLVMLVVAVTAAVLTCVGAPFCIRCIWKHRYSQHCPWGNDDITVFDAQWEWEHKTLILPPYHNGLTTNGEGNAFSTGDISDCLSVNGTSPSVSGNHVSQYTQVPLMRPPLDANQINTMQMMGLMGSGLPDYHSLQSDEPDLSHSDEGYSENGAQISPDDDWQEGRHPANRQDSGISMTNPDYVAAISGGSRLPDRGQHFVKHLSEEKDHAPAQSEKVTGKVTTV